MPLPLTPIWSDSIADMIVSIINLDFSVLPQLSQEEVIILVMFAVTMIVCGYFIASIFNDKWL